MTSEKGEGSVSRIKWATRALVVLAVVLATSLVTVAFPLLAIASNADPGGS
jgi:hypothetical protein